METSSISQEMLNHFTQLNDAEQQSVLEMVKTFVRSKATNSTTQTLEEYNRELERADAEIEAGDYVPHEEVLKRYLN